MDQEPFKNITDDFYPRGAPLCAKYKKGFAFKTINSRLPVILTKIIDQLSRSKSEIKENYGEDACTEIKDVVGNLAKLKNELQTNKIMTKTKNPIWNSYIDLTAKNYFNGDESSVRWYSSPWLFVECYMYHRVNETFTSSRYFSTFDPFQKQKEEGYFGSIEASAALAEFLITSDPTPKTLQILLEASLWGNRCDLSISTGEDNSQKGHVVDLLESLESKVLVNDSHQFWDSLKATEAEGKKISLGIILDNSGFELFTDFCLADALFRCDFQIEDVEFYVKDSPWFVSDAMEKDILWMLEEMIRSDDKPVLKRLALRWKDNLNSNRWRIKVEPFWTWPHAFHEMKSANPKLYDSLSQKTHLIFKGDLNYRKLLGDINWDPTTSFKDSLQGFLPTTLLAIRTLKADLVSGLRPNLAEELFALDPEWTNTGEYGLIQFAS